jgi:hypothetical protein
MARFAVLRLPGPLAYQDAMLSDDEMLRQHRVALEAFHRRAVQPPAWPL